MQNIGEVTVLYILILKFLDSKLEDKRVCTECQQALPDFSPVVISGNDAYSSKTVVHV